MVKLYDIYKNIELPLKQKLNHIIGRIAVLLLLCCIIVFKSLSVAFGSYLAISITANVLLEPPENLIVTNTTLGSVSLTWDKSLSSDYGHVQYYAVYVKLKTDIGYPQEPSLLRYDILDSYSDTISGLNPNLGYDFIAYAYTASSFRSPFDCASCKDTNADCGNGLIEPGEDCDGTDLNSLTCLDFGYTSGTLACLATCEYTYANCVSGGGGGGGGIGGGDTTAPIPGIAISPLYANSKPIVVTYSGASDSGGSGFNFVELWYKYGTGAWINSDLTNLTTSGSFNFNGINNSNGTYYFDLVAEDGVGNRSSVPSDDGDTSTIYDTLNPTIGSVSSPVTESGSAIQITYTDVKDAGGSGVSHSELWYKKGDSETWQNSELTNSAISGLFNFMGMTGNDNYYFEVIAKDNAGNVSGEASGDGSTSTIYNTVVPVAILSNLPNNPTYLDSADIIVGGDSITTYKYKIDDGVYSDETLIGSNIVLSELTEEVHTLSVIGKSNVGVWQQEVDATTYIWEVNFTVPELIISDPSMTMSHGEDVTYTLTYFNVDVVSLTPENITINTTDSAVGSVYEITEASIDVYTVTISDIDGKGTISISVSADTASNDNGNTTLAVGPSTAFKVRVGDDKDGGEDHDDQGEDKDKTKPSAPTKPTPDEIEKIIEDSEDAEPAEEAPVQPELPEEDEIDGQIKECKKKYPKADFDNNHADTDGDGLSDKTECYIKTHPLKDDTDGDKCLDGDEVNLLFSDPNDSTDCNIAKGLKKIIITNPQPNWIVKKLEITGITPKETKMVTIVAIPTKRKFVKGIMQALESGNAKGIQNKTDELNDFLNRHQYYDYENLWNILKAFDKKTGSYGQLLTELKQINTEPIVLGTITIFSPSSIKGGLHFELNPNVSLNNRELYNLVATAILDKDKKITSKAVRFSVDDSMLNNPPVPLSIADTALHGDGLDIKGVKIKLNKNDKVVITGASEYGARVFAIWQSVVLTSSVITDSEEGEFSIQSPKVLEIDTNHKVTLYAVKNVDDMTIRSENVNIHFRIEGSKINICLFIIIIFLIILLICLVKFRRKITRFTQGSCKTNIIDKLKNDMLAK